MEKNYMHIDGSEIYYEDSGGNQEVLVCIHGFISSSWSWHPLINQLKKHFRVIAFDLPGFGKTKAALHYKYTLSHYGETTIALIEKLNLKNVHLVGHSLGGQIALQAVKLNPNLFDKLFLIAASAKRSRPFWLARMLCYIPYMDEAAYQFYFQDEIVNVAVAKVLSGGMGLEDEVLKPYIDMCKKREVIKAVLKLGKDREDDMKEEELKKITHETYLLWGREDQVVTLEEGIFLKETLKNSTLAIIEHCGHLPMEEHTISVLHHLYSFFCPNFLNTGGDELINI